MIPLTFQFAKTNVPFVPSENVTSVVVVELCAATNVGTAAIASWIIKPDPPANNIDMMIIGTIFLDTRLLLLNDDLIMLLLSVKLL